LNDKRFSNWNNRSGIERLPIGDLLRPKRGIAALAF